MKNYLFKKIPRLKFQLQHPTVKICVKNKPYGFFTVKKLSTFKKRVLSLKDCRFWVQIFKDKTQESIFFSLVLKLKIKGHPTARIPNTSTLALKQFCEGRGEEEEVAQWKGRGMISETQMGIVIFI